MLQNLSNVQFLCKGICSYDNMPYLKALPPFSDLVCKFLNELSKEIMKSKEAKTFSDIVTFGFFCRKANIEALKKDYDGKIDNRLGKGVTFHIAPSNVPINFAYSLVAALLAGNSCIVRASAKPFRQIDLVCECINTVLNTDNFAELRSYISVVRYPHSKETTDYFSSLCDVRIIWGGDNTISEIRQSAIPPRATEIAFADRYSIAVIDAANYINGADKKKAALDFYNDTYLYDQNACSSPRLIYWLGDNDTIEKAKNEFWNMLHDMLLTKYKVEPVIAVDKYTASCRLAIDFDSVVEKDKDNLINRIKVSTLSKELYNYRCAGGSFIEYSDTNLSALSEIVTRKFQTLSYIGVDKKKLADFVYKNGLCGIDRIVPIGKTADFSMIWDGYDLIIQMSRIISF